MAEPFNVRDFLRQTSAGYNRPEELTPDIQKMLQEVRNAAFAAPNRPVGATPAIQSAIQGLPLFAQLDTRLYPRMEQFKSEAGPRVPPGYAGAAPVAPVDEIAAKMSKGSVPRNFWDGAIDRVFRPEPGPPQGINFGDRDFRAARAAADIVGGMRSGRGLGVASGVGTLAGVAKEIYDERNSRLAEQARPYTLAATLEAARQGLPEQSLAARPVTSENVLSPVPGGRLTTIGAPARKITADMNRRMGPEAPLFSAAPGAPITFPTAMAGASAAEAGSTQSPLTGRVTPGTGTVPTAPGQQRGELDLTGMKFKDAFEFARRLATREGVDATGRFIWNKQAYQTNINPARGRERYVPESRQTRLGDLPQLAETITPAPVGARSTDIVPSVESAVPVISAPTAATPAAPKKGALESLPSYESRRQAAQGYLGSRLAAGEGTLEQPIQVGRAELSPRTVEYLQAHPEHRQASTNPNLQREYVQLMTQREQLGITNEDLRQTVAETEKATTEGSRETGTVPHVRQGKYGEYETGGVFTADFDNTVTKSGTKTTTKSGQKDEKSKFLERFADWNRRNEEWNAREAAAKSDETYRTKLETLSNRISALDEIVNDSKSSDADRSKALTLIDQMKEQYARAKDLRPHGR